MRSSWGRSPSGPPQKVCPPPREHPAHAGTLWVSPQLGSPTLGTSSSAGEAGAPQRPLWMWGVPVRGITAETWHTNPTDDPRAGAPPSPRPGVSISSSRNTGCQNPKCGVWQERPRGFPTNVPSAGFEPHKPKFWPGGPNQAPAAPCRGHSPCTSSPRTSPSP